MNVFLQTAICTVLNGLFSVVLIHYLQRYLDKKADDEEKKKNDLDEQRKQRAIAEADRRHAAGRLLFWLYKGVTKPPPNGDLEEAMKNFDAAEARQKALEQAIIADVDSKNTM